MKTTKTDVNQRKTHTCSIGSGQYGIDWDQQPLGKVSDSELARTLGVSSTAVRKARVKRTIIAFRPIDVALCMDLGSISDEIIAKETGKVGV